MPPIGFPGDVGFWIDATAGGDMSATTYTTILMDEIDSYTYIGEATPGTETSESKWRIYRLDETGGGGVELKKQWANGSVAFDQVWDNRADVGTIYS
jgi:hypothetical protein